MNKAISFGQAKGDAVLVFDGTGLSGNVNSYKGYNQDGQGNWKYFYTPSEEGVSRLAFEDLKLAEADIIARGDRELFFMSAFAEGGDYAGGCILNKSNYDELLLIVASYAKRMKKSKAPEAHGVYPVVGGYGSFGLAVSVNCRIPELWQAFVDMENYPVLNEDGYYTLQRIAEDEAWESWAAKDYADELGTIVGYDLSNVDKADLRCLFEAQYPEWINEQGLDMWVRVTDYTREVTVWEVSKLKGGKALNGSLKAKRRATRRM